MSSSFHSLNPFGKAYQSHLSGLETLRHGTNPFSWLSIHLIGAVPKFGGSWFGGDYGCGYDSQNVKHFYMLKSTKDDYYWNKQQPRLTNYIIKPSNSYSLQGVKDYIDNRFIMRIWPKVYGCGSTYNIITKLSPCPDTTISKYTFGFLSSFNILLPSIKFHLSPDVVNKMENDPSMHQLACSTTYWTSPLNMGLLGVFWNSLTYKTVKRMYDNPTRVLTGVALVAISAATAYYAMLTMPAFIVAHQTAILAGTILAIV